MRRRISATIRCRVSSGCATPPQRGRAASGASHAPDRIQIENDPKSTSSFKPMSCACIDVSVGPRARSTSEKSAVSSSWRGSSQPASTQAASRAGASKPRREKKFARAHDHASVDCRRRAFVRRGPSESSRPRDLAGLGSMTFRVTYSSPRAPPASARALPLWRRSTVPLFDHLGDGHRHRGRRAWAPLPPCRRAPPARAVAGSSTSMSSPLRANTGMRSHGDFDQRIAWRGRRRSPAALCRAGAGIWPSRVPGGMATSSTSPSGSVICRLAPLIASRKSTSRR